MKTIRIAFLALLALLVLGTLAAAAVPAQAVSGAVYTTVDEKMEGRKIFPTIMMLTPTAPSR
jgi:hypothetical protein